MHAASPFQVFWETEKWKWEKGFGRLGNGDPVCEHLYTRTLTHSLTHGHQHAHSPTHSCTHSLTHTHTNTRTHTTTCMQPEGGEGGEDCGWREGLSHENQICCRSSFVCELHIPCTGDKKIASTSRVLA